MDRNPEEVVIVYLDTKFEPLPEAAAQGNQDIIDVFGDDMVYKVGCGVKGVCVWLNGAGIEWRRVARGRLSKA